MINIEKITHNLDIDGVAIVPSLFSIEEIDTYIDLANDTYFKMYNGLSNTKPTKYKYYTHFDTESCSIKNNYELDDISVLEIVNGRYDISYKYFNKINPILESITKNFIKRNYGTKMGLLTSDIKSNDGPWHRDVINLDGDADDNGIYDDSNMVHNMKPFYFTILIPLVELNLDNGTPEFIKGSHKLTYSECLNNEHIRLKTKLGDCIIFDGRIFHRGCANKSDSPRPVIYNVVHRNWYIETGN